MSLKGYTRLEAATLNPPPNHVHVRHTNHYCFHQKDNKGFRRVYHCVPYSEFETERLNRYEQQLREANVVLPADWHVSDSIKMLYSANFEHKKLVAMTKEYLKWRSQTFDLIPMTVDIMNSSFLFTLGKDKQFRPIVYVRLNVMRNKRKFGLREEVKYSELDPTIDWVMSFIRKECFRPYFIENWIMIVDADDLGIMSFPISFFSNLLKITQVNHPACLHKMYIVNPPFSVNAIFKLLSPFLGADTQEKINFLKKKDFHKILNDVDPEQLLEEYGGKLKLPQKLWPPPDTFTPEQRQTLMPVNEPETAERPYLYMPNVNGVAKILQVTTEVAKSESFEDEFDEGTKKIRFPVSPELRVLVSREKDSKVQESSGSVNLLAFQSNNLSDDFTTNGNKGISEFGTERNLGSHDISLEIRTPEKLEPQPSKLRPVMLPIPKEEDEDPPMTKAQHLSGATRPAKSQDRGCCQGCSLI